MPQLPWSQSLPIDPEREYTVMSSFLPLRRYRSIPGFLRATLAIRRQLQTTPGLVGFALLAQPMAKRFFTVSAWEDRDSLDSFARSDPHGALIKALRPVMGNTVFRFTTAAGAALPLRWDDVQAALAAESG